MVYPVVKITDTQHDMSAWVDGWKEEGKEGGGKEGMKERWKSEWIVRKRKIGQYEDGEPIPILAVKNLPTSSHVSSVHLPGRGWCGLGT